MSAQGRSLLEFVTFKHSSRAGWFAVMGTQAGGASIEGWHGCFTGKTLRGFCYQQCRPPRGCNNELYVGRLRVVVWPWAIWPDFCFPGTEHLTNRTAALSSWLQEGTFRLLAALGSNCPIWEVVLVRAPFTDLAALRHQGHKLLVTTLTKDALTPWRSWWKWSMCFWHEITAWDIRSIIQITLFYFLQRPTTGWWKGQCTGTQETWILVALPH